MAGFYALEGPKTRHKGVLWGMYVKPAARGRGLAKALTERVMAQARRERVEVLGVFCISPQKGAIQDFLYHF